MAGLTSDRNDPRLTHGVDQEQVPQAAAYLVLSDEERAKGFVRPVCRSYQHLTCGSVTTMGRAIAEMADEYPTALELAEAGYRGYAAATGGKTFDGRDMPEWTDLPERTTSAWSSAVEAIRARYENAAPPVKVETPRECGYYLNDPNGPGGTGQCRERTTVLYLVRVWLNHMAGPAVDAGLPLCAKHGTRFGSDELSPGPSAGRA